MNARKLALLLTALALALFAAAPLYLTPLASRQKEKLRALETRQETLFQTIRQLENDATMAEELSQTIQAQEVERFLAPMPRRIAARQIEALAAQARFEELTYNFAPSQPLPSNQAPEGVVQSLISLTALAPLDTDIFRFLDSLEQVRGRVLVQKLSLRKITDAPERGNIRLQLDLLWQGNEGDAP